VFFNAASGAGTATVTITNANARSINFTGFTGTFAGTSGIAGLFVAGSLTLGAGMTYTYDGNLEITGTGTLTTVGKTIGRVNVNIASGTLTLGDALNINSSNGLFLLRGGFDTSASSFNITAGSLNSNVTFARTINFNASTITITSIAIFINPTNLTFNAGTSQINMTGLSATFSGGGQTFHNVAFTNTNVNTITISGTNTYNNLSFTGPAAAGVVQVQFSDRLTINGTLSTTGTAGNRRVWFRSTTYGISTRLVVNSAPSLTDADFRDVIVTGTAAPISGTRIGDLRGNSGITFSAPKTVFRIGGSSWSLNQWAGTSGGSVSTDNFPLAQDTAVFDSNTSGGSHVLDSNIGYIGTINMSAVTFPLTLSIGSATTVYGNWTNGSGVTLTGSSDLTFSGRNTQTITSAGRAFVNFIWIDTFGGSVELADACTISGGFTLVNGTLDCKAFSVAGGNFSSSGTNPRGLNIASSTATISPNISNPTNLTFNSANSIVLVTANNPNFTSTGLQFNNVSFTSTIASVSTLTGSNNTFNNLSFTAPSTGAGFREVRLSGDHTVTGTLTVQGSLATRRLFLRSDTLGTPRTLSVGTLVATDCDFRDITIAGAAAGSSQTRAGNCGGNSGITFPAPKTVYWNLAGSQNWSATGWAASSGGTPAVNNFPLAQDTAVFDNAGAAGTVSIELGWNVGSFNASARTTAMTLSIGPGGETISAYGNWLFGTGITNTSTSGILIFSGRGTTTITNNGVTFGHNVTVNCITGTVQLADALTLGSVRSLSLTTGTFDAVTYNVTTGRFVENGGTKTLKMGSGTWTLSGTGNVWDVFASTLTFDKGTSNIVLSDNSTNARSFLGANLAYNKLTIGGNTSTSTTTITGNNTFAELASTKTVAHTINFGNTTQTFGAWTVTGTAGNVVTLSGTAVANVLAGAATSGIDYLAMGSTGFATTSPGEFYAGANSTGTAGAPVFRTAPPAARTLYWVGGTGNWGDTARWSTSSGGSGGAAVPTSLDNVIFNSASNATAYTATLNVVARCNQLTIAGPASGNLTLASSATTNSLIIHGNTVFPATGFTRTFSSAMVLSGSTTGKTFTSNGVAFQGLGSGAMIVNGVGAGWSMSDPLNLGNNDFLNLVNGTFSTNNHGLTVATLRADTGGSKTLNLGSSTVTMSGSTAPIQFGSTETIRNLFTFNAGSSQINISTTGVTVTITGNSLAFNHMSITATVAAATFTLNGTSTYNNLTFGAPPVTGLQNIVINGNLTVTGTLTFTAGTNATRRHFCRTGTIGTGVTITCAAFSGTDVDFRDIAVTGAAAPISGTRLGDCKGNSGITFAAGVSKFWNLAGGGSWSSTGWATTGGGTPAVNNFPLAQDTCVFQATGLNSGASVTFNAAYNIGTIDMSARTANTMTLETSTATPTIYGNWINGTGTTLSGIGILTFAGRGNQTLTSAGKTWTQSFTINTPGGTITQQDSLVNSSTVTFSYLAGTYDLGGYNATFAGPVSLSGALSKTLAIGSGTLTITTSSTAFVRAGADRTSVTGTGTISLTSASAKTFSGGDLTNNDYTGITLNNGGAGTLTITGNNTFKDITSTQTATSATTINLGTTTQRLTQFTGKGEATRLLTIQGTSVTSPATLIYTGSGPATNTSVDFLSLLGVRAYPLDNTWYAGNNSINNGTLGWIFEPTPAASPGNGNFFLMFL
jgi:hypothetical protein